MIPSPRCGVSAGCPQRRDPRWARPASSAASPSDRSTTIWSTSSVATSCAPAACAGCSSPPRARAAGTTRRCPSGTSRSRTSSCHAREWDALQIPVSVAFFFLNSSIDRVAAFYPGPAGATESLLPLDTWDELAFGAPRARSARPRRRGVPRARRARRDRRRSASSSRSTRATSWSAGCGRCGAGSTAGARPTRRSRTFFADVRARERRDRALEFEVARRARRSRTPRYRRSCCDCASPNAAAPPVHAVALRCQIRIEPQRRRYDADETAALVELFGEPGQWADSLRPFPWTHVSTTMPSFTGRTEIDLPVTLHLRLRGLGHAVLPRAGRRRDPAAAALLGDDVRRRCRRARRSRRSPGTRRRRSACRSRCGRR